MDIPEPPDLTMRGTPSGFDSVEEISGSGAFRREEIETMLQEGAWKEGFEEWAEYSDLNEEEIQVVADFDLFHAFDFYWDPRDEDLGYDAPSLPENWRERAPDSMSSTSEMSRIESELDGLGRTVHEVLQDTYLDWSDEAERDSWTDDNRERDRG